MREVDDYASGLPVDMHPLDFWKHQEELGLFPHLCKVARKLLALPSSTAEAERSFSRLRYLLHETRTGMTAETVNNTVVCRSLLNLM